MNPIFMIISGSVVGGIVGFLTADYLVFKKRDKEEEDQWFEEFPNEVDPAKVKADMEKLGKLIQEPEFVIKQKTDYAKASLEELVRPYETSHVSSDDAPRVISAKEWEHIRDGLFERTTILYYPEDSVYCYQDGEEFKNPQNHLGPNAHLQFGISDENDPEVVYVLNRRDGVMFEVIKMIGGSYKREVLGIVEEDNKSKTRVPAAKRRAKSAVKKKEILDDDQEFEE